MILLILILLLVSPVYAAPGVAVVQSAAPTSNGGTQDFTSSGFGTPTCALFFGGYGTANGTVVNHAGLFLGFSDFTNERYMSVAQEDNLADTDTGGAHGAGALASLLETSQAVDGTAVASTITNGARLTWADAPPSAFLIQAVLFNSSAVSNCAVGTIVGNATQDATASVSGLGWQPDIVIAMAVNSTSSTRSSFGMAINDGGVVQYAAGQASQNAVTTSDVWEAIRNDRLILSPLGATGTSYELTSFDSGGFTITTRDSTTPPTMAYMAIKLASGVGGKLLTCTSPTSTGNHSCTGTGWTPQAGIMITTDVPGLGTYYSSGDNNEVYGISAFTSSASYSASIWDDDTAATSNTESVTDSKPVRSRKANADFMTATLTGPQNNGWDFSYSATDATARYRVLLSIQSTDTVTLRRRGVVLLP